MDDSLSEMGAPPPAPNLTRRDWLRVGVGVFLLTLVGGIGAWLSIGDGRTSAAVYGNGRSTAARTWSWDGTGFRAEPLSAPGPSSNDAEMAFDRGNQVVVLWDHGCGKLVMGFTGGCQSQVNQTWTWAGQSWTRQRATAAPSPVGKGAMLYDSRLQQVLYLNRLGDAWAWTGSAWRPVATAGAPHLALPGSQADPARAMVAVGYDEMRNLLVLALPQTTWTWDGRDWRRVDGGIDGADGQTDPHAVYDAALGQLVYLGARSLWTWNGSRWQGQAQPNLAGASLGYDPVRRNLVAAGQDAAACDTTACPMRTLTWDGTTWSPQPGKREPMLPLTRSGAFNPPMAFDEASGRMLLFASSS